MNKGFIFDLDGVIVDTAKYHYLAWKKLAHELGFEFTKEDNERLKGVSRMASLDILLEVGEISATDEEKFKMAEQKNADYLEYIKRMTPEELLPGAKDFLKAARAEGIKTALGSASKNAMLILRQTGITDLFDAIVDGNCVSQAKPDPEVFLNAAKKLQLQDRDCVVFEDAVAGVEAANRAGMKCVGIGSPEVLTKADFCVDSLADVTVDKVLLLLGA
ncbi:MAG: beta-phosphoglucomutase [Culturomica sp.]|jgi:beta-phosphoglucomutase|nr:beta-phosphoglucomutase [Culturomica sp.]